MHHPSDKRLARTENELDDFERLHTADESGQHPEYAGFGTTRSHPRRWWLGKQAAIARAVGRIDHRDLALKLEDRAIDEHLLGHDAGVVNEIAGREIIAAVHYDVEVVDNAHDIFGREALLELDDIDIGVERVQGQLRRLHLGHPDPVVGMQYLALEVAHINRVMVGNPYRADSGCGQI